MNLAAAIAINTNLPGMSPSSSLPGFVTSFYNLALLFAGILAFGAIVYGGVKYAVGKGNPSSETEGKAWITGALLGLLLLAGAYIILYTVNPQIVALNVPGLPQLVTPTSTTGSQNGSTCSAGQTVCGSTCCTTGQTCDQTGNGPTCHGVAAPPICSAGQTVCGQTCCASGQTCNQTGIGPTCSGVTPPPQCSTGQTVCGQTCCAQGQKCYQDVYGSTCR